MEEDPKKVIGKNVIFIALSITILLWIFLGNPLSYINPTIMYGLVIVGCLVVVLFVIRSKNKKKDTDYDLAYKEVFDAKRKDYLIAKARTDAERDAKDTRTDIEKFMDKITGK
jgi:Ca2+/Na+ antiporter